MCRGGLPPLPPRAAADAAAEGEEGVEEDAEMLRPTGDGRRLLRPKTPSMPPPSSPPPSLLNDEAAALLLLLAVGPGLLCARARACTDAAVGAELGGVAGSLADDEGAVTAVFEGDGCGEIGLFAGPDAATAPPLGDRGGEPPGDGGRLLLLLLLRKLKL